MSLKIIQTGTIRDFLFAFHSNYGCIVHHLQDKTRYWSKILIFFIPLAFDVPVGGGGAGRCIAIPFIMEKKLEWSGYLTLKLL